jgi:hypothetical protein
MCITIHPSFLPREDPDTSLAFDRGTLGFGVRADVGYGEMRGITLGPSGQPGCQGIKTVLHSVSSPATAEEVLRNG